MNYLAGNSQSIKQDGKIEEQLCKKLSDIFWLQILSISVAPIVNGP
jgi:hypothetical protein